MGGAIDGQSKGLTSQRTMRPVGNIPTYQSRSFHLDLFLRSTMLILQRPRHSHWPLSGLSLLFPPPPLEHRHKYARARGDEIRAFVCLLGRYGLRLRCLSCYRKWGRGEGWGQCHEMSWEKRQAAGWRSPANKLWHFSSPRSNISPITIRPVIVWLIMIKYLV